MIEILGSKLDKAFEVFGINARKTYQDPEYQVWEMDEKEYEKLNNVSDDDWKNDFGWWRKGNCIYEGTANADYVVNGLEMMGYSRDDESKELHKGGIYDNYTEWLSEVMDLGTIKNIAIFAISLAKDNNMTLAEFMYEYQS